MSQKLVVVVAEGTGKQGGAVVKSLLEQGHTWGISRTMFGIRRVRGGCSPSVGCNYYSVSASDADWTSSEHLARILHVMVPHVHAAFFRGFTESHFDRGGVKSAHIGVVVVCAGGVEPTTSPVLQSAKRRHSTAADANRVASECGLVLCETIFDHIIQNAQSAIQ